METHQLIRYWPVPLIIFAAFFYVAGIFTPVFLWDDATLIIAAERVAEGQLPHADFTDVYSGLMNYFHAGVLTVLPRDYLSMRIVNYALFLVVTLATWRYILPARFRTLGILAGLAFVMVGPVLYPPAMPSWYNLFFALAALIILTRDRGASPRWLAAAGALLGLSVCFKVTGLYALAGVLTYLAGRAAIDKSGSARSPLCVALYCMFLVCAVVSVWLVTRSARTPFYQFILLGPPLIIAGTVFIAAIRNKGRFPLTAVSFVLTGSLLTIAPMVIAYAVADELPALIDGLFVKPLKRFDTFGQEGMLPSPEAFGLAVLSLFPLFRKWQGRWPYFIAAIVGATWILVAFLGRQVDLANVQAWSWLRAVPLIVSGYIAYKVLISRHSVDKNLLAAGCVLAFGHLIQIPFPHGIYVLFFAPLSIVCWALMTADAPSTARPGLIASLIGISLASIILFKPTAPNVLGYAYMDVEYQWSEVPGVSVKLKERTNTRFGLTAAILAELDASNKAVFAGPDSPHILYAAGSTYWQRASFDLFENNYESASEYETALLSRIDEMCVEIAVVNRFPPFSRPYSPWFIKRLYDSFVEHRVIDNVYIIFWKRMSPAKSCTDS